MPRVSRMLLSELAPAAEPDQPSRAGAALDCTEIEPACLAPPSPVSVALCPLPQSTYDLMRRTVDGLPPGLLHLVVLSG